MKVLIKYRVTKFMPHHLYKDIINNSNRFDGILQNINRHIYKITNSHTWTALKCYALMWFPKSDPLQLVRHQLVSLQGCSSLHFQECGIQCSLRLVYYEICPDCFPLQRKKRAYLSVGGN